MAQTAAELSWLTMLLSDLHVVLPPPTLWFDNLSAISLSSNPVFHARSKHIEVDYHYVRERVAAQKLFNRYVSTSDQVADILTKPLSVSQFQFLQHQLLVRPPPISLQGDNEICKSQSKAQSDLEGKQSSQHLLKP